MSQPKRRYRVRNWPAYNAALVQRGALTIWVEESSLSCWYGNERAGRPGAPTRYSDQMIQMGLVLREVFHLPLRALEGFLGTVVQWLGLRGVTVPDYTTFCRRQQRLEVRIPRRVPQDRSLHLVIDSSGLKIHGEGEWKRRMHGPGARRRWRKLHLAMDPESGQAMACVLTADFVTDDQVLPELLEQVSDVPLASVTGDGAYDTRACHAAVMKRGAHPLFPPREGATEWEDDHPRTAAIQAIRERGRGQWKQDSGYHRRSLVENAFFRLKQLFGARLGNRRFDAQCTQAYCRIAALNRMTGLGMPKTEPVAA